MNLGVWSLKKYSCRSVLSLQGICDTLGSRTGQSTFLGMPGKVTELLGPCCGALGQSLCFLLRERGYSQRSDLHHSSLRLCFSDQAPDRDRVTACGRNVTGVLARTRGALSTHSFRMRWLSLVTRPKCTLNRQLSTHSWWRRVPSSSVGSPLMAMNRHSPNCRHSRTDREPRCPDPWDVCWGRRGWPRIWITDISAFSGGTALPSLTKGRGGWSRQGVRDPVLVLTTWRTYRCLSVEKQV